MKKSIVAVLLAVASSAAFAAPITLTLVASDGTVAQSASNPCIIAATNCPSNPITFNNPGNGDFTASQSYTYTPGTTSGGIFGFTKFDIAVDSGTASGTDTLSSFLIEIAASATPISFTTLYTFTGSAGNIGNPVNNGNGFADYLLQTVDLSSVATGSTIKFTAVVTRETGGPESFFIKALQTGGGGDTPVPAPAVIGLLGLGLASLSLFRRRAAKAA